MTNSEPPSKHIKVDSDIVYTNYEWKTRPVIPIESPEVLEKIQFRSGNMGIIRKAFTNGEVYPVVKGISAESIPKESLKRFVSP